MERYLWKISNEKLSKTNLALYSDFIKNNYDINLGNDFNKIWQWSVNNPKSFWKSIWEFTKVKGNLGNNLLEESQIFFKNKFFVDSKLNYAENLLRKNNDESAIIFKSENGYKKILSWKDLNFDVASISEWMKSNGVKKRRSHSRISAKYSRNCNRISKHCGDRSYMVFVFAGFWYGWSCG